MKKSLILALALLVSLAMAVTGTIAYLQDTDEDVNVMTLGNVKIEQLEFERVVEAGEWVSTEETDKYGYTPDKIQAFTQDKPLYPIYAAEGVKWDDRVPGHQQSWGGVASENDVVVGAPGSNQLFDDSVVGAVDKFVFVANTGTSDAYVRTWFAFEQGSLSDEDFERLIGTNADADHWSWETVATGVEIDGNTYVVAVATYLGPTSNPTGILAPGTITYPSLLQVYMAPEATNDDVTAVDGNANGTYDILVLSQAVQTTNFPDAKTALDAAFGGIDKAVKAFSEMKIPDSSHECWDGTVDTSWYNDTDTEFVLTTAEQLAGLAKLVDEGETFEGKTIKLGVSMDLNCPDCNPEGVPPFNPIGSYRKDAAFMGTFDGQGYTISNLTQDTWSLDTGYYYGDLGLGLFGKVKDATIRELILDGASISGESAICGTVAATAYGDCTFENITVKNSEVADYQYYAGGVVGWASGDHQYIGITIDESVTIGSQWGDFGNASGGIIGGSGSSSTIYMKDCTVACRIDAVCDVVSAYQWYCYRNCGMLIGNSGHKATDEAVTNAAAPHLTCENVTVIYGEWANYTYCEFAGTSYPYVRVQAGTSVDAYTNVRYGHPTDANGDEVVDDNHTHNDGEAHHKLIVFDQLYGGPAEHRYCTYGVATHDGVTVVYNNK